MKAQQAVAAILATFLLIQAPALRAQIAMKDLSWYLAHAPFAMPAVAQPSTCGYRWQRSPAARVQVALKKFPTDIPLNWGNVSFADSR